MFIAKVKDRESGEEKFINSTQYCKSKKVFRNSLKKYYIVKEIIKIQMER